MHVPRQFYADLSRAAFSTHSRSILIPLAPIATHSLRPRHSTRPVSTETARPTPSDPPPSSVRPSPTNASAVSDVPPPGSPPPLSPAPLGVIPPKVTDLADEAANKELARKEEKKKPQGTLAQRAWAVTKKEAAHYWAGTKLLGQEIKISAKLLRVVLKGDTLTRRERRQVSVTVSVSM